MIKFITTCDEDGDIMIGLGFSEENIKRLQNKQPVLVNLKEMGLDVGFKIEILVFAGKDEDTMIEDLEKAMGPVTLGATLQKF